MIWIASNSSSDWIDGISNGGLLANLEVNLKDNYISINNLPGIGSVTTQIEKFENISGTFNSDTLIGDSNANNIIGNAGDDVLIGLNGNDILKGGLGDDYLEGGKGKDIISGGEGNDMFIFSSVKDSGLSKKGSNKKIDWITDFDIGEDTIHFNKGVKQDDFSYLGEINKLTSKNINRLIKDSSNYDYDAIAFDLVSSGQTFVAINGSMNGFQSGKDLLVDITGYNGNINNIQISTGFNSIDNYM